MIKNSHRHAIAHAIAAAALMALPVSAMAAGALAVGYNGVPRDGVAFGTSWNYKTTEEAGAAALRRCKDYKSAPKAVPHCKLFDSFVDGCLAIAFDPKDDSPGMGWAVAVKREAAEGKALGDCRDRAPQARRQFCKIVSSRCEGDPPADKK